MKNLKTILLAICALFFAGTVNAQKIKLISGSLDAVKTETSLNTEFTYDANMQVGKKTEKAYVSEKKSDLNKKEAGRGDMWAMDWVGDRKTKFEPKFNELLTDNGFNVQSTAKYTVIFHTIATEPGFNVYMMKKNAEIDAEVTIVETANKSNVIAKISVMNAPGRTFWGGDFDTGVRIQECYATAGKYLAKFLKKGK
jgi:outer membrane lipopolysaccharide assembly protein LptE/RlpB